MAQIPRLSRGDRLASLVLLVVPGAVLAVCWPAVWLVLPVDGAYVAALLLSAAGWGAWPAAWLAAGQSAGRQVCLATALGLGVLSTATLALGVAGLLSGPVAWALLAAGGGLGAVRLVRAARGQRGNVDSDSVAGPGLLAKTLVLLPLCVPIVVVLYAACLPPWLLWAGEARGYDVLEYHLQVPREYFDAGRILFLPHNVYASFPQGVETLYLLLMYLAGGPLAAAIPAQLLHATLGGLTVAALLAWTPRGWPRVLVALVVGTTAWLAYLGSLAYVELGVLFFTAVAAGLLISEKPTLRTAFAAGICAGLAGGCKYTALVLVAAALGSAWLIGMRGGPKTRAVRLGLYGVGAILAFSPWLIRNAAFTGNPVYPFAYGWFGGRDWSAAQAEQWQRGHSLPVESASLGARARIAFDELLNSGMYNQALWLLGLGGLALLATKRAAQGSEPEAPARANPSDEAHAGANAGITGPLRGDTPRFWSVLAIWAALIVIAWAAFTHMPGRFAVPVIIPLALLVGRGVELSAGSFPRPRPALAVFIGFSLAGAVLGDLKLVSMLRDEAASWQSLTGVRLNEMIDRADILRDVNPVNTAVPAGAYVWMVGDARAFYVARRYHYTVPFSTDPWLEFSATADPSAAVAWLRTHGVTHVVFSWSESARLRRSYGFPPHVTPAWADALARGGLKLVSSDREQGGAGAFEVYEVMP